MLVTTKVFAKLLVLVDDNHQEITRNMVLSFFEKKNNKLKKHIKVFGRELVAIVEHHA